MNFAETNKIAKTIQGWLTSTESEYLFSAAARLKKRGVIVEIGSFKGKSTAFIGNGAKASGIQKLYCVDPHIGSEKLQLKLGVYNSFEEFQQNCRLSKVDDIVIPIVDISENAIKNFNEDIEFMFIDGDHEYDAVKLDYELWSPKVVNGGIISFHDTNLIGPRKVVFDSVLNSTSFRNAGRAGSIIYAEKVEKNTFMDRIKNKAVIFSLQRHLFNNKIKNVIPLPIKKFVKGVLGN